MSGERVDYRALLRDATLTIERLTRQRDSQVRQPAAIVGMGCRFPGGVSDPDRFWALLQAGTDAVVEVPKERWDIEAYYDADTEAVGKMYTRRGGFIRDVDRFDAEFFGISPREAVSMDPQQRLLLEVAWEALERAAIAPSSLAGSPTGVYLGISAGDYMGMLSAAGTAALDAYFSSGTSHSIAAGRLSYVLGLRGPSLAVDTACSSSLVAIHLACQALNNGDCSLAIAGGVNLVLLPEGTVVACRAHMMSPDGRCKTFDAAADGFVRAEGCGLVVLKKLADAERDGDRILAVIKGSAINQDGRSGGLTVPSGSAQEAVIRKALAAAGIGPDDVGYVETHGTGTSLGDPIEVRALGSVFGQRAAAKGPLTIGSVKTNLGHLEAAAGVAGLIKLVLCLQHEEIPPHLHFNNPTPHIPWDDLPFRVPTERLPWQAHGPRIGGLSSFGFSGTNAHLIVEQAPAAREARPELERPAHLLAISARDRRALTELGRCYGRWLDDHPATRIEDVCFTANAGRSHLGERLALVVRSAGDARAQLERVASGAADADVHTVSGAARPEVVFMFTGQGAQYASMARLLFETQPAFRRCLEQCDEILGETLGARLLAVLFAAPDAALLDQTRCAQPALFAVEYALARLWMDWGIRPAAVLGHSLGEYTAACIAGAFDLEQGLKLVAQRGRLMQELPPGAMAAVFAPATEVASRIEGARLRLAIAAINGPRHTVVSGAGEDVDRLLQELASGGVESQRLHVSHAFHSHLVEPMVEPFARLLEAIDFKEPAIDLVSNVDGRWADRSLLRNADYWCRQLRSPVQFEASIRTLEADRHRRFLEIGPHPTLSGMARSCVGSEMLFLPSLRRGDDDWRVLLESLRQLYQEGFEVDWQGFDRPYGRRKLALPTYPFQRQRFWLTPAARPALDRQPARRAGAGRLAGQRLATATGPRIYAGALEPAGYSHLDDHKFFDRIVVAGAHWLAMTLEAVAGEGVQRPVLRDVAFPNPLFLDSARDVQLIITAGGSKAERFQVWSRDPGSASANAGWLLHAEGGLDTLQGAARSPGESIDGLKARLAQRDHAVAALYSRVEALGLQLGPSFRWLKSAWTGAGTALVLLQPPDGIDRFPVPHPGFFDSCFQALGIAVADRGVGEDEVFLPLGIEHLAVDATISGPVWCHASLRSQPEAAAALLVGDIVLLSPAGKVLGRVDGLTLKRASRSALVGEPVASAAVPLFRLRWSRSERPRGATAPERGKPGSWLLLVERGGLGEQLADWLEAAGASCFKVYAGDEFAHHEDRACTMNPDRSSDWLALGRLLRDRLPRPHGWIYLWGLDRGAEEPGRACRSLLAAAQAMVAHTAGARLWLVTRLAQALDDDAQVRPSATALSGLGRVFGRENPECLGGLIDIGAADPPIEDLAAELLQQQDSEVSLRRGQRFLPELEPVTAAAPPSPPERVASGSYLVTGGLTGLGWEVAQWLAERGAHSLVLVGRRPPAPPVAEAIAALERRGISIRVALVDIGAAAAVDALIEEIRKTLPPLKGVVHSAGVVDDGVLLKLTAERLGAVMHPKVGGALNLARATEGVPLDFFVLFSSLASVVGSPGQGAYVAANAFLDGLAGRLQARGRRAVSISWGPWADVGMVARLGEEGVKRLQSAGLMGISPQAGLETLGHILDQGASVDAHLVAAQVDWRKFAASDPSWARRSVLRSWLAETRAPAAGGSQGSLRAVPAELLGMTAEQRDRVLGEYVRQCAADVLRLPGSRVKPDVPLINQGFDSLMALELRNRIQGELGLTLPLVTFVSSPTVEGLSREIASALVAAQGPGEASPQPAAPLRDEADRAREILERLDQLSEDEIETLIEEMGGSSGG